MTSCLSQQIKAFWKEANSKRKQFKGSKFFPFRVDRFSDGRQNFLLEQPLSKGDKIDYDRIVSPENVSILLKVSKSDDIITQ